jgi:DNA-binding NarL/FixJ family response regulator
VGHEDSRGREGEAGESRDARARFERLRIVIAERDSARVELLTSALQQLRHQVAGVARDGPDALVVVGAVDPDLLLLGARLPDMDGTEVCRRLMAIRPLPIVFVARDPSCRVLSEASAFGAVGCVQPSQDPEELDAALGAAVSDFRVRYGLRNIPGLLPYQSDHAQIAPQPGTPGAWPSAESSVELGAAASGSGTDVAPSRRTPRGIRLLLLSETELVARALATVLDADPELESVVVVTDRRQARDQIRRTSPEVVVLDCTRPDDDWAQYAAELHAEFPAMRLLVVGPELDEDTLTAFVQAGTVGHISISYPPAELIQAIKRVSAGEVLFSAALLLRIMMRSRSARQSTTAARPATALGPREIEVLQAFAGGMSTEEVATSLGISINTVRTHLKNILARLGARSKLEAVIMALRSGLIELHK